MDHPRAADPTRLTLDEFVDLPDDGVRSELVRGRLVREPPPNFEHGRLQSRIGEILGRHIREHDLQLACVGEFGVILSEVPPTVRGPDAAVVQKGRLAGLHRAGYLHGSPDLVIEIVSPSNRAADIQEKVLEYLAAGAHAVWVVYPKTRTVEVHEGGGRAAVLHEGDELTSSDLMPALRVRVAELFAE